MVKVNSVEINLMELLKNKDPLAISSVYDQYAPALYGIIFRIVKSDERAEFILEQTFLRVLDEIEKIKNQNVLFSSMYRMARTSASAYVLLNAPENSEPVIKLEDQLNNKDCSELMEGMDSQCEQVINHLYLGGHSVIQTSQVLNISEDKVKSQFRCALTHIHGKIIGGSNSALSAAVIISLFTQSGSL